MNTNKCVYLITNDFNDKKYIGVTENFNIRMNQHKNGHDIKHSYIDKSIQEHGWEHYTVTIIDNYQTEEERKELEKKYIKEYHSHRSENGYNLTWGGDETCFPNVKGDNNPRAQLTAEDVKNIRQRRMNGERLSDVYEDYKEKCSGGKRSGFSKAWLHESWLDVCPEFKGHYPVISTDQYAVVHRNNLLESDIQYIKEYLMWFGPLSSYGEFFKEFKDLVDWGSFRTICKQITDSLYGNKDIRKTTKKNGKLNKQIEQYRLELKEPPVHS